MKAQVLYFNHYTEVDPDYWRWPNFTPKEIACRGTGKLLVNEDSLDKLQELRAEIGLPFHVNSGYRSPEYNKKVGGAPNSFHMQGMAFDISLSNLNRDTMFKKAEDYGFNGIGQYNSFIHIDTRDYRARWDKRT